MTRMFNMNAASGKLVFPSTESRMSAGQLMLMMSLVSPESNRSSVQPSLRARNPHATMMKRMIIVDSALRNVSTPSLSNRCPQSVGTRIALSGFVCGET